MSRHTLSFADNLFAGAAFHERANGGQRGLPVSRLLTFDISPEAAVTDGIAQAQAVAGQGSLNLNGSLATGGVATMATPRVLRYVSSNVGDTTQTITTTGTDFYGMPQTETVTLNGTTVVNGKKAFATVTKQAVSAVCAGNVSTGTIDTFGLPYFLESVGHIVSCRWAGTLATDAGTAMAGDGTTATASTGDVRGTYAPSSAADAVKRLVLAFLISDTNAATKAGAFGVTPA